MMTKTTSTPFMHAAVSRLEAIRSVALRLFVTEGYRSVSLRQLAEQAGIQAGSLYHHIESKQCLLFDLRDIIRSGVARRHFQVDDLDIAVATVRAMLDGAVCGPVGNDFRAEVLIKAVQQMVLRSLLSVDAEPNTFYE